MDSGAAELYRNYEDFAIAKCNKGINNTYNPGETPFQGDVFGNRQGVPNMGQSLPSMGQSPPSMRENLSSMGQRMYNSLPNISGRLTVARANASAMNPFGSGNYTGIAHKYGGKRRTKKSKGAKKSRKVNGGKRKGRKSRRY
jgi:hypothetical protein